MKTRIRCLSVREPHVGRIERREKLIELRHKTITPGPLVIAASADRKAGRGGEIRCLVNVVECRQATDDDADAACVPPSARVPCWSEEYYAIVLDIVRPLPRTPVSGKAWIYYVEVDV